MRDLIFCFDEKNYFLVTLFLKSEFKHFVRFVYSV